MKAKDWFDRHYPSLSSIERYKFITLLFILTFVFLFCLYFSIAEIREGKFFANPGYYLIGILSLPMVLILLKGHYRFAVYAVLITFSLTLSFSQMFGEYREIEILTFILMISFASIYAGRKFSIPLTFYCLVYLIVLYFVKREIQVFSPSYLVYSLFFLIVISAVNILNSWILELNIVEISNEVRKRTKELNDSKEYAELIFHYNPSAAYTVDQQGRILDFNIKAEELTGYSKEEMIGVNETILVPYDEVSLEEYRFVKSGESVGTLVSKEGKEKTVARYSALLTNEKKEITGKIVSFTDLTEWREFENYKTDMERVIRHDLKTPLNSVIGFPSVMLNDENLSDEYREFLNIIRNAGLTMKQLIDASRYLYKIEEGSYESTPEEIDILNILRQIDADLSELQESGKLKLVVLIDGRKPEANRVLNLVTEKILFQMILSNLIKNALEASPPGLEVSVSINTSPRLSIAVHNMGVIPESIRERFFEKYVTMNKKKGTGLGTYSARLMSMAIGADLSFSTSEEDGTTLLLAFKETVGRSEDSIV